MFSILTAKSNIYLSLSKKHVTFFVPRLIVRKKGVPRAFKERRERIVV